MNRSTITLQRATIESLIVNQGDVSSNMKQVATSLRNSQSWLGQCRAVRSVVLMAMCILSSAAVTVGQTDVAKVTDSFELRTFDFEGTRFAYRVRRGAGPTLLLVPGSFNDTSQWTEMLPELGQDWSLVFVDIRGHGESWPPPKEGTIEQFAQDVIRIADHAKVQKFFVGGHSIGGMIALEVGRAFPERVEGVISMEGWTNSGVQEAAFSGHLRDTLTPELLKRRSEMRIRATRNWTEAQRKEFAQIWKRWDGTEFLRSTPLPILEIWGDRGRPLPSREQMKIPDRPNIQLVWISGASHSLPLERPVEVGRAIHQFVSTVEKK